MNEMEWSKKEKEIARHAYRTAYERECMSIALNTRKMAERINEPSDLWKIHDFLTKKREETDQKYDYRYSILLTLFARLVFEGWIKEEELTGLSEDKLKEIH
jgi:Photoprotection regulator fluorescence recovery protein